VLTAYAIGIGRLATEVAIRRPGSERTTTMSKPTHMIYHVIDAGDGREGFWMKIGAGWMHKDGEGIGLDFEVFPTKTGRVTLRKVKEGDQA
jgi:hypothetical protein